MFTTGYWFDRLWRKWIKVKDHARTVLDNPKKFRLSSEELYRAMKQEHPHEFKIWHMGVLNFNEDLRASVIIRTAQAGFIRVRETTGLIWAGSSPAIPSMVLPSCVVT